MSVVSDQTFCNCFGFFHLSEQKTALSLSLSLYHFNMAPSSSPSPSKKLLITDPKPKPILNSASSSSTSTTPPPDKRTREQPNLSDCHCCSRRINHSNPKDRLQPLDSVWRIVLLCRKCRKSVHSGQTCPYCLCETGNSGDLFTCRVCLRKIHKDCVRDYGNCTPWCYLGVGLEGFSVCVDCWVPELLKNSIRVFARSENKGGLENVVLDGKCEMEKKVKRVAKTKEQVLRRVKGAMEGVDLLGKKDRDSLKDGDSNCSGAIEAVDDAELAIQLHRFINSSPRILSGKSSMDSDSLGALNIRSWKGLSYKRPGLGKNSSEDRELGVGANDAGNGRMNQPLEDDIRTGFSGLSGGLLTYKRDRNRKIWLLNDENTVVCEPTSSWQAELKNLHSDDARNRYSVNSGANISECANADRSNSCMNDDRFEQELVSYMRTMFKQKVCQVSGTVGVSVDNSSCSSGIVASKSEYSQSDDADLNAGILIKSDTEVVLPSGNCDLERDHYHPKYIKRTTATKPDSSFPCDGTFPSENQVSVPAVNNSEVGYSMNDGKLILPNGTFSQDNDRYSLKYAKRVNSSKSGSNSETELHSDAFLNKIDICGTGLTVNYSAESRTLSNISSDSFTIDLPK